MSFFDEGLADRLLPELKDLIRHAADHTPRSTQKTLGPSEIGHNCDRHIAYKLARTNHPGGGNRFSDPWASILGTAAHTWFQGAIALANERLGRERWLSERRVSAWDDVEGGQGTCDLYDRDTFTVIDLKNPGAPMFKRYVNHGPGDTYETQVDTYGAGYTKEGIRVDNVGVLFIPRAGRGLRDAYLWTKKFDPGNADRAHQRMRNLTTVVNALELTTHPERISMVPTTPGDYCRYCPHFSPEPEGPYECKGTVA